MNVLVTGSNGFIGKNLCLWLKNVGQNVLPYDLDCKYSLSSLIAKSDFIFHLAGVNRPLTIEEFYDGNANLTLALTQLVARTGRNIPICFASSVQAALNNDYGKSKKMAEDCLINFSKKTGNSIYIFRLQNVFGKWCKPNYNSVIATFCYNVSHGLPISITDRRAFRDFVYIDDICRRFITLLDQKASKPKKCVLSIEPSYKKTIGEIADLIREFKESRANLLLPCVGDEFVSKLYATYLSYLEPTAGLEYQLDSHVDQRGSFTEFLKTQFYGQLSINKSNPGITKGNHYHHTKNEKFLVLKGRCSIKLRKVGTTDVFEYIVDGNDMRVIDIPCGYTHSITNIGEFESITLMWASELFDPEHPDTFFEEV